MENKERPIGAASGVAGKLQNLKQNSTATVSELREFIAGMRGKSPKEALGLIAQSRLVRSIALSTAAFIVLLAVLTIVPYLMKDDSPTVVDKMLQRKSQTGAPAQPANSAAPTAAVGTTTGDSSTTNSTPADPKAAAAKMGLDETKQASPDKNPLEDKLDDLLDLKK